MRLVNCISNVAAPKFDGLAGDVLHFFLIRFRDPYQAELMHADSNAL